MNESQSIVEILNKILLLQRQDIFNDNNGCDRPFLGQLNNLNYNTRPIELYNSYTAEPWTISYTSGETTAETSIFRIESIGDCCVTLRLLSYDATTSTYTNTNQFVTINLKTIGAIQCFPDTYVTL